MILNSQTEINYYHRFRIIENPDFKNSNTLCRLNGFFFNNHQMNSKRYKPHAININFKN